MDQHVSSVSLSHRFFYSPCLSSPPYYYHNYAIITTIITTSPYVSQVPSSLSITTSTSPRSHQSAFAKLSPNASSPPPRSSSARSVSSEEGDGDAVTLSPEAQRFASYYGDADELKLRALKRGIIKFNQDPKIVSKNTFIASLGLYFFVVLCLLNGIH